MGRAALLLALLALLLALFPAGMYAGMGLAGFAGTAGLLAYRRRHAPGWSRLAGAAAVAVGGLAFVIAAGRFALTWWAVGRLTELLAAQDLVP